MIDETSDKGRIIAAAMRLAGERPWSGVSLLDIAEAAGLSLVDLKAHFTSKSDIIEALARAIDDEMLKAMPPRTSGQSPRDALFEIIMGRFDALAPYKQALRSISGSGTLDPALLRSVLVSQHWMLEGAGIGTDGVGGGVRMLGLASVYASVFRTWLNDDDRGLARTMAALDRRLRSGERTLRTFDDIAGIAERIANVFSPFARRSRPRTETVDGAETDGGPTRPMPGSATGGAPN